MGIPNLKNDFRNILYLLTSMFRFLLYHVNFLSLPPSPPPAYVKTNNQWIVRSPTFSSSMGRFMYLTMLPPTTLPK